MAILAAIGDEQLVVALCETSSGPYWPSTWRIQRRGVEDLGLVVESNTNILLTPYNFPID